jgi:RNA polymerase sigma-70 factor, ECF subfamily
MAGFSVNGEPCANIPNTVLSSQNIDDAEHSCPEELVAQLYLSLRSSLRWYGYQLLGSSSDAEDLVQVAFVKVFDQLKRKREIQNLRGWLYRVVHNLAIDELRRHHRRKSVKEDWAYDISLPVGPPTAEDQLIQQQMITRSLNVLNKRERRCFELRAQGLSYKEISQVMTISAKAVSVYLARGQKKVESAK